MCVIAAIQLSLQSQAALDSRRQLARVSHDGNMTFHFTYLEAQRHGAAQAASAAQHGCMALHGAARHSAQRTWAAPL